MQPDDMSINNDFVRISGLVLPELLKDIPITIRNRMWFQYDVAPAHFNTDVCIYLDVTFWVVPQIEYALKISRFQSRNEKAERDGGVEHHSKRCLPEVLSAVQGMLGLEFVKAQGAYFEFDLDHNPAK
ncbi:hypothetical protein TNCV_3158021 [Trichonephila clavipes]|nr:hypothetical protein TNCV_3158021 [Trichonephila clavipes]